MPEDYERVRKISKDFLRFKKMPGDSERFQKISKDSERFKKMREDSERFHAKSSEIPHLFTLRSIEVFLVKDVYIWILIGYMYYCLPIKFHRYI